MSHPLSNSCDVLIVGAGAYGLSAAWFLAQHMDPRRITVIDRSDFAGNGTGRCVGGFRTQWGHSSNILMAQESVSFFENAPDMLDYPQGIDLKQAGYLILAWDQPTMDRFRHVMPAQHSFGVKSELLTPEDVARISPLANQKDLLGASFCERDGTISPFRLLDALLTATRKRGVSVHYGKNVAKLQKHASSFSAHLTSGEKISAAKVLLCTDWETPTLSAQVGSTIPVRTVPVEIMVTEPTPPILGPVHISMKHDMAINQMQRGSIVINHGKPRGGDAPAVVQPDWIESAALGATEVVPALSDIRVLRAWAGQISVTPDMQPILDRTEVDDLYVAVSAYKGLMTAPAAGRRMADMILGRSDNTDPVLPFVSLSRFSSGALVREPMTNGAKLDEN